MLGFAGMRCLLLRCRRVGWQHGCRDFTPHDSREPDSPFAQALTFGQESVRYGADGDCRVATASTGAWSNCGRSSGLDHFWRLQVKISTFGANHSSRRSRVPSCTKTMPEPSFRLFEHTREPQLVQKTRSSPWPAHVSVFGP